MKFFELHLMVDQCKDFETGVEVIARIKAVNKIHAHARALRFVRLVADRGTKYSWLWYMKELTYVEIVLNSRMRQHEAKQSLG